MSDINQDIENLNKKAEEAARAGNPVVAGILRVAADNRASMAQEPRRHRPNLGPYTPTNEMHCVNCGKPLTKQQALEEICPAP